MTPSRLSTQYVLNLDGNVYGNASTVVREDDGPPATLPTRGLCAAVAVTRSASRVPTLLQVPAPATISPRRSLAAALLAGLLHGPAETLPISSSAHVTFVARLAAGRRGRRPADPETGTPGSVR